MIKIKDIEHNMFKFPAGEMHVKLLACHMGYANIYFEFERNEEIVELLLICNALKKEFPCQIRLEMPYVPFGRQDRVSVVGECFSLSVFADLINSIGLLDVTITDPHSDVTTALLKNCVVIEQHDVFAPMLADRGDLILISPDGGALKKIYKLARAIGKPVVECSKQRDTATGEINGVVVHANDLEGKDCYIVDDICDGGRTFIEIAKVLRQRNCGKIVLMVTHGFFTKGLDVFTGLIDEIYTRKGRLK